MIELVKRKVIVARMEPIRADRLRFRFFNPFKRRPWEHGKTRGKPIYFSKSDSWENGLLLLLFNNTNFANVGDATGLRGSTTAGSLYLSLHTADPGEAGTQATSEITYTSYARKAVARASGAGGFTVSGSSCTLTDALTSFVAGTGGSGTATYFGVGTASSGAGVLLYSGTVTPNIVCGNGVTPQLTSSTAITED